ncbi:MAG: stage II sporulation protein P [Firmicutes bacterium]|nr:stage II sporulation protein P [Bacillota bacterium]
MRRPIIIWWSGSRRSWNRPGPRRGPRARAPHPPAVGRPPAAARAWRWPWGALTVYGLTLAASLWVLAGGPRRLFPPLQPVTAPLGGRTAGPSSWAGRTLAALGVEEATARAWVEAALPAMLPPAPAPRSWRSWLGAALADLSGSRIHDLRQLVALALPVMEAAAARPLPAAAPLPPGLPGPEAVDPALPGDHGRVWAQLGSGPLIGIYHTFTRQTFGGGGSGYSTDWPRTVVQVGWWLAQDLHRLGVPVVQARVDNMRQGLLDAYHLSYRTARQILTWYPGVRVLLDVARGDNPDPAATTVELAGVRVARIAIVVGTNRLLPDPYWHQDLRFALRLAGRLEADAPGILEGKDGVSTVPYRYNQELLPADLLIRIGGPGNTLAQERYAASYLAEALAQLAHTGALTRGGG